MLFVCWLWNGRDFPRSHATYSAAHVGVLQSMLARHGNHRLAVVTDQPEAFTGHAVRAVEMPADVAAMPDFLPKLWAWSPAFHALIGERFASIDLDVVIAGDLGPILYHEAAIRFWRERTGREPYNTSLFTLTPGNGQEVWTSATPEALRRASENADYWVGDQSWIAHVLPHDLPTFGEEAGVMQYRPKLHRAQMPAGMVAGFMCGPYEPAGEAEQSEWVRRAWR